MEETKVIETKFPQPLSKMVTFRICKTREEYDEVVKQNQVVIDINKVDQPGEDKTNPDNRELIGKPDMP